MTQLRVLSSVNIEFQGQSPARELMEEAGLGVEIRRPQPGWLDAETREKLVGFDALLAGGENLNASTMDNAESIKIIARNGVGFDKVDLDYCTGRGIVVTNTPGAMADAVADHAFALLLGLTRQLVLGDRRVKGEDTYDVPIGEDLSAMTLGLIGCGHIGAEVVHRALGFKMRVLVHDPWIDEAKIRAMGAEPADRDQLLAQSDAITLHAPLTGANHQMVNAEFLGQMKEGSYLINTARGGLIDEAALIAALRSDHLAGAGLDCQATEPPQGISLELVRLDNVLAQPHSGSKTLAARKRMALVAARAIADILQGKVPDNVVNKAVLDELDLQAG
jgi:phosphoglycerate dehydrogenase-like enzyme